MSSINLRLIRNRLSAEKLIDLKSLEQLSASNWTRVVLVAKPGVAASRIMLQGRCRIKIRRGQSTRTVPNLVATAQTEVEAFPRMQSPAMADIRLKRAIIHPQVS
jgi:hypothetical protein